MQGRGAGRSRGNNAGRGGGRLQGRGNNAGRGGLRRAAVGKDEADSLKRWSKATIATNSDISFASLWRGAKAALQNECGDATKVLLRMEES